MISRTVTEHRPGIFNRRYLSSRLSSRVVRGLTVLLVVTISASSYADSDEAISLLKQMSVAADGLDYSGEFVYVRDGKISAMKISHVKATESTSAEQKLMALDGSMREIIVQDDIVACVLPDEGMGLKEKKQSKQPFKLNISGRVEDIYRFYEVEMGARSRVADRDCQLVDVTPRDNLRYGYRLCVDDDNALLLQSELTNQSGKLLESYMFVNIEFGEVSASQLESHTPAKQLIWMDDQSHTDLNRVEDDKTLQQWRVGNNQSGFELEQYIERMSPVMQANITHLVLGDGLAKVSVFVAKATASANKQKKSLNMGSLNSYTLESGDYMITAIGEVPRETVSMIARATQRKQ